ncbi:hypothetical protein BBSC_0109 [Bifidobacterium scardovii JCM 12489 = DSM 13734]|nr:hypothetical protein BBSC_0109 [Bifidobacterium scardovii JCM 12489 = DSM 13734]
MPSPLSLLLILITVSPIGFQTTEKPGNLSGKSTVTGCEPGFTGFSACWAGLHAWFSTLRGSSFV